MIRYKAAIRQYRQYRQYRRIETKSPDPAGGAGKSTAAP